MCEQDVQDWLDIKCGTEDKIVQIRMMLEWAGFTQEEADDWLCRKNPELGGKTPREVISGGDDGLLLVHDFVADMITGRPA